MVTVTDHCVERFMQKSGKRDPAKAKDKILEMFGKAQEVELKPQYRATQLLRHDLRSMRYMRFSNWLMVADDELTTVVTIYPASAFRWAAKL